MHTSPPQVGPGGAVLLPQRTKSQTAPERRQAGCLQVRLLVHGAGHQRADLAQAVVSSRSRLQLVARYERAVLAPLVQALLDICLAAELGDIGSAAGGESAERLPV